MGKGFLEIKPFVGDNVLPVKGAKIFVKDDDGNILHELTSDENGITKIISLDAPDKKYSSEPYTNMPRFATYDVEVPYVKNYKRVIIHDVEIFDEITTILPIHMHPAIKGDTPEQNTDEIYIPLEHGVDVSRERPMTMDLDFYDSDNITMAETILANEVRIPEYITVHLGSPNASARNVRVPFVDYIKNVASSEIFPTWHESALYANIYAQISFALNRIYTVWYRSRGFDFDITSSTAFDQSFVEGRDIFQNISRIVDGIFNMFIRRQGRKEPFISSYCNGTTVTCAGLSQWGSQDLALRGYSPMQILKYYYPSDIQIVESNNFVSDVSTYPGTPLREGSSGADVRKMQTYLNRISGNFYIPSIPNPDGHFGTTTKATTMAFQGINDLIPDGIIGKNSWYAITRIYVGVKQLAELTSEGERIGLGASPLTVTVQIGDRGEYVTELQFLLNFISEFFPSIPFVVMDSVFRDATKRAVTEFQQLFGLTPDGIVGPSTWSKLYAVFESIEDAVVIPAPPEPSPTIPPYPGTPLRIGSQGANVLLMQNYLNAIAKVYTSIPTLTADGIFGSATHNAVVAFQNKFGLTADGVIGSVTWYKIIDVYMNLSATARPPFPGTALRIGSRGSDVQLMQNYLNAISKVFPVVPSISADGVFGALTQSSVMAFQSLFGLTTDGVIGKNTWDKIVDVYNDLPVVSTPQYPGTPLRVGSSGNNVTIMQKYLNVIASVYTSIPVLISDGIFGAATERSVKAFQNIFGLSADGIIGKNTWNWIVSIYNMMIMTAAVVTYSVGKTAPKKQEANNYALLMMLLMCSMPTRPMPTY